MLTRNARRFVLVSTIAAGFWGAAAQADTFNWTAGTSGDASGTWAGVESTFNGQGYFATDDLIIDGTAAKTITTTGAITSPLSLTVNSTGATTLTGTSVGGTLTKSAAGALTLPTANTFGDVTINGGKFVLNGAAGLGTTGTLNINSGAVSGVTGSYSSPGNNFVYDSSGINADYTFSKNISFGTVASATTYGMAMRGGATRTTTLSGDITGASNVTLWLDTSTASDGSSIWSLTGDNSGFAGTIRLNRGRLFLGNANAGGTGTIFVQTNANANGNLVFGFSGTVATNITFGTIANDAISTNGNNVTLTGVLNTSVSWDKVGVGTLTLTGTKTGVGGVRVMAGTLQVGNGGTTGTLGTGAVTNNAAVAFNRSDSVAISNIISGTGVVNQIGTGNTTLSAANTYSGQTTPVNGTLTLGNSAAIQNSTLNLATGEPAAPASSLFATGATKLPPAEPSRPAPAPRTDTRCTPLRPWAVHPCCSMKPLAPRSPAT